MRIIDLPGITTICPANRLEIKLLMKVYVFKIVFHTGHIYSPVLKI